MWCTGLQKLSCEAKIHELVFKSPDEASPRKGEVVAAGTSPTRARVARLCLICLGVYIGQVLRSSDVTWFLVIKAKQYAWLVQSLSKNILDGSCLPSCSLFQWPESYSSSRYLPLSPEGSQWGQSIPSSGREELLPTSPHSFEAPLGCANQQKAVWGKKPDPAALVKIRVSLAWHCI